MWTPQVDRTSVLEDAYSGLRATNMLSTSGPCVVMPCFITHIPAYVNVLADNPLHSNHVGFTEEGEGFGPRKEFFLLAGQAMIDQLAGNDVVGSCCCHNLCATSFLIRSWLCLVLHNLSRRTLHACMIQVWY